MRANGALLVLISGICLAGLLVTGAYGELVNIMDLTANWTLANRNLTFVKNNVKLPSGVYSALHDDDLLHSYNDVHMRWISLDNWTYTRTFTMPIAELDVKRFCNLTFHGIDTVAEIRLNSRILGRTSNMFVRYSFDVTDMLNEENVIEVEIFSPIHAAKAKADVLKLNNTNYPPACPSDRYHGECHMNMLRKMQVSFAWDWSLAAPSMGLWKPVTLECYEVALIRDVDVVISKNSSHWKVTMHVHMDVGGNKDFFAELKFYAFGLLDEPVVIGDFRKARVSYKNPVIIFTQDFLLSSVLTWWPNGYGEQNLYNFNFVLNAWLNEKGSAMQSPTTSQKAIRVGFRTVELVEQEITKAGNGYTFLFKVNNEEMFMKGANYVPAHILPEKGQEMRRIRRILLSAKEANMNMIRVWGGGIYESDFFYELADIYGLLIWQDMMFANSMYPVDEEFLSSVRDEVSQNARRIAYHPSVVIFATNNENQVALAQNWYGTLREQKRFETEYRQLYLNNVLAELKTLSYNVRVPPLVSSPSNGKREDKFNYLSADPQNQRFGDVHFFVVHENGWNVDIYPTPRFVSEYGFQSLPRMESWKRSMSEKDDLMELIRHRQHHPMAMLPIVNLVRSNLPLPLTKNARYSEALIYFSQVAQAMATKVQTEWYRSLRDTSLRTMGALYYQLNDVWVAPSWSSIDYFGNYKLLHYWAKEFFAPVAIMALYDSKSHSVNVTVVCDDLEYNNENLEISVNLYTWDKLYPKNFTSIPVHLKPNGVLYEKPISKIDLFTEPYTEKNAFVEFILHRGLNVISTTYYFPTPFNQVEGVADPQIKVDITWKSCVAKDSEQDNAYNLKITVQNPAIFVYIEFVHPKVKNFRLSRNGFMQVSPVEKVDLFFSADECIIVKPNDLQVLTVNEFMVEETKV